MNRVLFSITILLLAILGDVYSQTSAYDHLKLAALELDKFPTEKLSSLATSIFAEAGKVVKDPTAAKMWNELLKDKNTTDLFIAICEKASVGIEKSLLIDGTNVKDDKLDSYWRVKLQVAIIELVTKTLRQDKTSSELAVLSKLDVFLPCLGSLHRQEVVLKSKLGSVYKPVLTNTSPPPARQERIVNEAKALLVSMQKAQEVILDAFWPVYVMRLNYTREKAILNIKKSGLTKAEVDALLKQAYGE